MRDRPLDLRGRWIALTAATVALQFSFWPIVAAATADPEAPDALEAGAGLLALGLALVPLVFGVLAFTSRHPRAPGATLRAMGLFVLVGLPVGLANVILGTAVGFAAGSVVALRGVDGVDTRRARWLAVVALALYLGVLLAFVPPFGIVSAAALPLAIHGLVDQALDPEARSRPQDERP